MNDFINKYETLEPGDYLIFDGSSAIRGSGKGYCVIGVAVGETEVRMHSGVDPARIQITDCLTQNELIELPARSVVVVESGDKYTKVVVGRGVRWQCGLHRIVEADLAALGARLLVRAGSLAVGDSLIVVSLDRTGSGNYRAVLRMSDGREIKTLLVLN